MAAVDCDNEIILCGSAFWVVFRRRVYGPFDYQWSHDLRGIELTFRDEKFGEVCSREEFYADLKPWNLPLTVCRAAAVAAGMVAQSIPAGLTEEQRAASLTVLLEEHGVDGFRVRISAVHPQAD